MVAIEQPSTEEPMVEAVLNDPPVAMAISPIPADSPEGQLLRPVGDHKVYNIVHLIYRARNFEGHSKDYDFSRASMQDAYIAAH
jgi:NTE family protein